MARDKFRLPGEPEPSSEEEPLGGLEDDRWRRSPDFRTIDKLQHEFNRPTAPIRPLPEKRREIRVADAGLVRNDASPAAPARPTRFPWQRELIAKYKDVTAEAFSQGKYAKPVPTAPGFGDVASSFLRHAGSFLWSMPAGLAESTLNWLDFSESGHNLLEPGDILSPLGMGVGGAMAQIGKSGTTLGVFGGRVTGQNLAKQGRPAMYEVLDMARGMEAKGFSEREIIDAGNAYIAKNDPRLGGLSKHAGDWKVELSDAAARMTPSYALPGQTTTLGRELTHPELFKAHPELRDMPFKWVEGQGGAFFPPVPSRIPGRSFPGMIQVGRNMEPGVQLDVILHEVQHAVAAKNKFAAGGDARTVRQHFDAMPPHIRKEIELEASMLREGKHPSYLGQKGGPYPGMSQTQLENILAYRNIAGEVEARNVEKRIPLTPRERREQHPSTTEDVPRGSQIDIRDGKVMRQQQLGPPSISLKTKRHFKAPNGTIETMAYDVVGPDGKTIATLKATYFPAGKEFKISDIEVVGFKSGDSANVLSPRQLRQLMREIRKHFPQAEWLTGFRVSGFRGKRGEDSGLTDKLTNEEGLTKFPIPRNFKSETGLPPLELLPRNESNDTEAKTKKTRGKGESEGETKAPGEPGKKDEGEKLELEREPDVWIDEHGIPNIRVRPKDKHSQLRPWEVDEHATRNVKRRVEVVKVDDRPEIQEVTVMGLDEEEMKLPLRGQPFGMTSNPRVGSVGYLFAANGRPDQAFLMGLEHPEDRVKNKQDGESHMYGSKGQEMGMKRTGNLEHRTPRGRVYINSDVG